MSIMAAAKTAGVQLKKVSMTKGGEWAGPCPKCEGTDRFLVWPEDRGGEGSFWCRGCRIGGDLVQFYKDCCGMEYPAAFRAAGREMPDGYRPERYRRSGGVSTLAGNQAGFEPRVYDGPVETWQMRAERFVADSHAALVKNEKVMGWLARRGLDRAAVERFRLGWFAGENGRPCMFRPRLSWGLPEILKSNGRPKMLWMPRGVVIPWLHNGQVRRIKIRRPGADLNTDRDVKYYFVPGSSPEPALLLPDRRAFVRVESELDGLLVIHHAGAVAGALVLGSSGNKPDSLAWYALGRAVRILDALDYDDAGARAGKWWREQFDQVKRWPVPKGKDPGEAFEAGVDILAWVLAGLPPALTLPVRPALGGLPDPVAMADRGEARQDPGPDLQEEAGPVAEIQEDTVHREVPPDNTSGGLAQLYWLLRQYPVKIRATKNQTTVICAPAWRNDAVFQQISRLVFFDLDVAEYLDAHPAEMIHRGNF